MRRAQLRAAPMPSKLLRSGNLPLHLSGTSHLQKVAILLSLPGQALARDHAELDCALPYSRSWSARSARVCPAPLPPVPGAPPSYHSSKRKFAHASLSHYAACTVSMYIEAWL